jgi:DnaK suppressor protein
MTGKMLWKYNAVTCTRVRADASNAQGLEAALNTSEYKRRLMAEEQRLLRGIDEARENAVNDDDHSVGDAADASVSDVAKDEQFGMADRDTTLLDQVRAALQRIEDGTYGKCVVDGGPIEEKRLNAMPWTPYCKKHQEALEASHPVQTPTL